MILRAIMNEIKLRTNATSVPRPCDCFDLIAGTSTGGLIAIMLGKLGMVTVLPKDASAKRHGDCWRMHHRLPEYVYQSFQPWRSALQYRPIRRWSMPFQLPKPRKRSQGNSPRSPRQWKWKCLDVCLYQQTFVSNFRRGKTWRCWKRCANSISFVRCHRLRSCQWMPHLASCSSNFSRSDFFQTDANRQPPTSRRLCRWGSGLQ